MRRDVGRWTVLGGAAVLAVALLRSTGEARAPQSRHALVDFDKQVKPILGGQLPRVPQRGKTQGRTVAGHYADVLDGGTNGAVIRPGHAGNESCCWRGSRAIRTWAIACRSSERR